MRIGRTMRDMRAHSGRIMGGRGTRRVGGRDYGRMADYGRSAEYRPEYLNSTHSMPHYERARDYGERDYERSRDYGGDVRRVGNFEYDTYYGGGREGDYGYDYYGMDRDYGDSDRLTSRELKDWARDLMDEIAPEHKATFDRANFEKRAREMGLDGKEYSLEELYVATLMVETDYGDTLKKYGINNLDAAMCLAKDFLEDRDSDLRYGDKLGAYYFNVVCIEG